VRKRVLLAILLGFSLTALSFMVPPIIKTPRCTVDNGCWVMTDSQRGWPLGYAQWIDYQPKDCSKSLIEPWLCEGEPDPGPVITHIMSITTFENPLGLLVDLMLWSGIGYLVLASGRGLRKSRAK
jgi:hypothetical protein